MQNDIFSSLPDEAKSNPRAASLRIQAKPMSRAKGQRRHDLRIGKQPNYVDYDRNHLNRVLVEPRPLPRIQRENEALRSVRGCLRNIKSNAAVVVAGIITFGHEAQIMFACLTDEQQDAAYLELAERVADRLCTCLESLSIHLDESANHAHFELRGYTDDGIPVSKIATRNVTQDLQDITAEVMQKYCPDMERGNKKWNRISAGAAFAETINKSVKQLHQDLPSEIATKKAELQVLVNEVVELRASIDKTQSHLEKAEARRNKTAQQLKRVRYYTKRLNKKKLALEEMGIDNARTRVQIDTMNWALKTQQAETKHRDAEYEAMLEAHNEDVALNNAELADDRQNLAKGHKDLAQKKIDQQIAADVLDADLREQQRSLVAQKTIFDEERKTELIELDNRQAHIENDKKSVEKKNLVAEKLLADAKRQADMASLSCQADESAAKAAREQVAQAQSVEQQTLTQAAENVKLAKKAEAALIEIELAKDVVRADVDSALVEKNAIVRDGIAANEQQEVERLKHRAELEDGITVVRSVISEMVSGSLKLKKNGKLTMDNREPFQNAPAWLRTELFSVMRQFAQLRSKLDGYIARVGRFLQRDDLTVDARDEAELLERDGIGIDLDYP